MDISCGRGRAAAVAAFVLLMFLAPPVAANMANPYRPGDRVGEPAGELAHLAVVREELRFDLTALEQASARGERQALVQIEARYQVRNDGPARNVDLVFAAAGMARPTSDGSPAHGVWLDGVPVPSQSSAGADLPQEWQAPVTTPSFDDDEALPYEDQPTEAIQFTLGLTPGPHEVLVRYAMRPAINAMVGPTVGWQVGYVLAPAKQWASFGQLDVTAVVPAGWDVASSPPLTRRGNELVGTFSGVPSDTLALTVRAPAPAGAGLEWLGLPLGFAGCVAAGVFAGRWAGRRRRSALILLPLALFMGFVWAIASPLITFAVLDATTNAAGGQASWTHGYGQNMLSLFSAVLLLPSGVVLTQLSGWISARRARARAGAAVSPVTPFEAASPLTAPGAGTRA